MRDLDMDDRTAIIEAVDTIFDTVDAKDWEAVRSLFAEEVDVDFTSLAGGDPARITVDQLVGGWVTGLHKRKQSWHFVSHYRVRVTGDTAVANVKGYAWNRLDEGLGGGMWEVWGTYELSFARVVTGWQANAFRFTAQATRGDDNVRTHVL
jgi:hypothetical protein